MTSRICFLILLLAVLPAPAIADTVWNDLRDGAIHIRKSGGVAVPLALQWRGAWIPESQEERVYFQNPDGTLNRRVEILPDSVSGSQNLVTESADGVYRLEVPGASFRSYRLQIPGIHASMIEPVKVHLSISAGDGQSLYFKVPADQAFRLCGKSYKGVDTLTATSLDGSGEVQLALTAYSDDAYSRFDSMVVPAAAQERIFRLTFGGSGKISFWLDDIPNLFAQQPAHLFDLTPMDATSLVTIGAVAGQAPAIGAALPFAEPPAFTHALLDSWALQATNYYFFQDTLTAKPDADQGFLSAYQSRFNLRKAVSILSNTGRQPLIEDTESTRTFLQDYLKRRHDQGLLEEAAIAFADEPNLNYSDVGTFEEQFVSLATTIKQHSDPAISSTRLAYPQSSRFWNGPTRDGAEDRRGSDMAERMLASHYELFDTLSWHEWQVRDLIATDWYFDSINRAHALMKRYQGQGQPEKALSIAQTNISSGFSLSPYEQDTFFASLWWTSVVTQSARTGKLSSLIWFKAADDGLYNKGLASLGSTSATAKPVSDAMRFVTSHLGATVLATTSSHPELDVVGTQAADGRLRVLGVNKGDRLQHVTLKLPRTINRVLLLTLDADGEASRSKDVSGTLIQGDVAPRTVFAVEEVVEAEVASPPSHQHSLLPSSYAGKGPEAMGSAPVHATPWPCRLTLVWAQPQLTLSVEADIRQL